MNRPLITTAALQLGDIHDVTADLTLPADGQLGAEIQWDSSNDQVLHIADGTGYVTSPAAGQADASVTLTATVSRGAVTEVKNFKYDCEGEGI